MQRKLVLLENEEALIRQAIQGDADAYGIIYLHYLERLYRYIAYRVEDEILAEDLTEEVFTRAWEALPRYQMGSYPLTTWLYRIARNLITDHYRKRRDTSLSEAQSSTLKTSNTLTEEQADHNHTSTLLRQTILRLGEDEQQVIILRFIEGLSYQEIASVIGKSEGACRVIQHRALVKLYHLLNDPLHDDVDDMEMVE